MQTSPRYLEAADDFCETYMDEERPEPVSKLVICSKKIKAFRLKLIGKTNGESAILLGVTERQVRRKNDWWKKLFNVFCDVQLSHEKHARDMVFVNEEERQDYLENHAPNRVTS